MISIRDIVAGYGEHVVLDGVSLEVKRGEFIGLIGPNGCGKTTLMRVISGVLPARSGAVLMEGSDVRHFKRRELARSMAVLSQDLGADLSFTVREIALMGRAPHLPRIGVETRADRNIAEHAMVVADIWHLADQPVNRISGGERQRAFFAMCLAQQPRVLLLDEPMSHLDIGHQITMLELIRGLNRTEGLTVMAVFHDLNLAAEYCDRLMVLHRGKVQAIGPARDVVTPDMIRRVYDAEVDVEPNRKSGKPFVVVTAKSASLP
jgi:iron complex transport system ATP-binding protein